MRVYIILVDDPTNKHGNPAEDRIYHDESEARGRAQILSQVYDREHAVHEAVLVAKWWVDDLLEGK